MGLAEALAALQNQPEQSAPAPGLFGAALPWIYSQGDRLKRHAGAFVSDPLGSIQQTAGGIVDAGRAQQDLMAKALANPARPFQVTDQNALGQAVDSAMAGPMGFAPMGMVKNAAALDMSEAARMKRAADQGFEGGWWRGGKAVADGPHYTPDKEAAEAFAKRHGPKADVREYAISPGKQFNIARTYGPDDLTALRDVLKKDYGAKNADELLSIPSDFKSGRAPGGHIFQAVEMLSGGNGKDALKAAGFDTLNAGQELIVLNRAGTVRDKALARFDPKQRFSADPLASLGLGAVGLGLLNYPSNGE